MFQCMECGKRVRAATDECPRCGGSDMDVVTPATPRGIGQCLDCGKRGERTGHQDCQFPQDH